MVKYVHGYSARETKRLRDQSTIVEDLLHEGTNYPVDSKVLEAGCGVGAQTVILAKRNPGAAITSIDISCKSISTAKSFIQSTNITNVAFHQADIYNLPFADSIFDHVFICFVLEHLDSPIKALREIKRVVRQGGTITIIEGDHGSCYWHPETLESRKVWQSLIDAQTNLNHDPLIGRKLYPLLLKADLQVLDVSPRWIYTDGSRQVLKKAGVCKIIIPMLNSSKEQVLRLRLIDEQTWEKGIADLNHVAASSNGTFFYSWFKAVAIKDS